MFLKPIAAGATLALIVVSPALAQISQQVTCAGLQILNATQISNVLTGNYACIGSPGNLQNNELHSGGNIIEYGSGNPQTGNIGTYTITHNGDGSGSSLLNSDTITYNYNGPSYQYVISGTSSPYNFCGSGTGIGSVSASPGTNNTYTVTVQASHC